MNENQNPFDSEPITEEKSTGKKYKKMDFVALILCLLISISIWIYVMNTNQTTAEKTVTLTVDANGQIFDATGMTIFSNINDTFEGSDMDYSKLRVELTVTGMKNVLDKYSSADFVVKVDTSEIEGAAIQRLPLVYVLPTEDITFKSMTTSLPIDSVYIDKQSSVTLTKIGATLDGVPPFGEISMTPRLMSLQITGPEKTVNSITRAEAVINLAGYDKSTTVKASAIRFYGLEGEIKSSYIKVDPEEINVDVLITVERRVPITLKQSSVGDGTYIYTATITGEIKDVLLKGDSAIMDSISVVLDLGDITKLTELSGTFPAEALKIIDNDGNELEGGVEFAQSLAGTIGYSITKSPIEGEANNPPETTEKLPELSPTPNDGTTEQGSAEDGEPA